MLVRVRQHGQKAGALDGGVDLTLVNGTGASQTRGDDLAVFSNEITQRVDVFVVHLFDIGDGETAVALALEEQRLGIALRALVFIETLGCSQDGPSYVL